MDCSRRYSPPSTFLPVGQPRFDGAVTEALELTKWYAREHVVLCLLPAFWIAGAIAAFVSQASVMRYLGPKAPKPLAYGVGSVSGTILAVCSCTVLPLFSGIYRMGAGSVLRRRSSTPGRRSMCWPSS